MEFIILILLAVLAEFTIRGLFNKKWREESQSRVDGIKQEKIFWNLMSGAYGVELDAVGVSKMYFISLSGEITVGSLMSAKTDGKNSLIKNIIKKKNSPFKNIELLNKAIVEREAIIKDFLEKNRVIFTDAEIRKQYNEIEDDYSIGMSVKEVSKNYDRFIQAHFDSLTKGEKTGINLWEMLKKFEDKAHEYEYDITGNSKIKFLGALKEVQLEINKRVAKLIYEKIENKDVAQKIEKALKEWQQLHMLCWCVVNYTVSAYPIGSNYLSRAWWRIVAAASQ